MSFTPLPEKQEQLDRDATELVDGFFQNYPRPDESLVRKILKGILENTSEKISTYEFIYYITVLVRRKGQDIINPLLQILENDLKDYNSTNSSCENPGYKTCEKMQREEQNADIEKKIDFAAYYAASLYYKRYKKKSDQINLVETYGFSGYFDFAILNNEILARYWRRKRNYRKALKHDELALKLARPENDGLKTSYCSTVADILEEEERNGFDTGFSLEERKDLYHKAYTCNREVLERRLTYGKYHSIRGRLLLFQPKKGIIEEKILQDLRIAKEEFYQANEYEDPNAEDYHMRCADNLQYIFQCDAQITLGLAAKNEKEKITRSLQKETRKLQVQVIQLLGIFTAVITIIITTVQLATCANFTPYGMAIAILIASLAIIIIYSVLRLLFADMGSEIGTAVIAIIVILICIGIIVFILSSGYLPDENISNIATTHLNINHTQFTSNL